MSKPVNPITLGKVRRLMAEAQRLRAILRTYAVAMSGDVPDSQYSIYHSSYEYTAKQYQETKNLIIQINLKMLKESK